MAAGPATPMADHPREILTGDVKIATISGQDSLQKGVARLRGSVAVLVLAALGVLVWPAAPACACSCVSVTPEERFALAEAVFLGTVRELNRSLVNPRVATAIIEATEVRKGSVPTFVTMQSVDNGDSTCAYEFAEGHRYLIFGDQLDDGSWRTGSCAGTTDLGVEPSATVATAPMTASRAGWWTAGRITLTALTVGLALAGSAGWLWARHRRRGTPA